MYKTNNNSLHDNMSQKTTSYLEIIVGSMFSQKTSKLVDIYKKCNFCNIRVVVLNHSIDNRYDDELMSTHDKVKIPCIKAERLMDVYIEHLNMESNEEIPRIKDK
jgi:thymidine kinase